MRPHRRVHTVGGDQDVGADRAGVLPGLPVGQPSDDAAAMVFDANTAMAEFRGVGAQAADHLFGQHHVERAPVHMELWPVESGFRAKSLRQHVLAEPRIVGEAAGRDSGLAKLAFQPEMKQLTHAIGLQVDASARRPEFPRRLIDGARDAELMQRQRRSQPANAATDDHDFHAAVFQPG